MGGMRGGAEEGAGKGEAAGAAHGAVPDTGPGSLPGSLQSAVRPALTRRRLLKLGLALGGVALVTASGAAYVVWPRAAAPGRRVLAPAEVEILRALADAYLPPENPFGVAAADADIVGGVDEYLAALPLSQGRLMRALLVAVDQWPRLSLHSGARFSDLAREDRVAVLAAFETSGVKERRQLASVLRLLVAIPYFDDERVRASPDLQWGCPVIPS